MTIACAIREGVVSRKIDGKGIILDKRLSLMGTVVVVGTNWTGVSVGLKFPEVEHVLSLRAFAVLETTPVYMRDSCLLLR